MSKVLGVLLLTLLVACVVMGIMRAVQAIRARVRNKRNVKMQECAPPADDENIIEGGTEDVE